MPYDGEPFFFFTSEVSNRQQQRHMEQQQKLNTSGGQAAHQYAKTNDKPMTSTPKVNDNCENDKTKESTGSAPKVCIRQAVTSRTQEDD
ncbi:unnamed protein product [Adineta ricciae]|uniref:Uncharacterized protein n=1 Tax=Adineta ricciae TaxID=249248 RepID=A0A815V6H8_ADIRI|nr:unnamed protein product [Adineta ricciae]CAF1529076.1 unnamed protein product [Adineta ricciae]